MREHREQKCDTHATPSAMIGVGAGVSISVSVGVAFAIRRFTGSVTFHVDRS